MQKGKLITIDGADGAGKKTQTKLLVERLRQEGHDVATLDFPQYENNVFGQLLKECLRGERGDFMGLDARVVSTLFAADRFESKETIEGWLAEGKTVVLDRYVSSNMLHQTSRIEDAGEREEFLNWLTKVEYEVFGIPRPDLTVYCALDPEIRVRLLREEGKERDVAENDLNHQQLAEANGRALATSREHWYLVECAPEGQLRTPEDIGEEIYQAVMNI